MSSRSIPSHEGLEILIPFLYVAIQVIPSCFKKLTKSLAKPSFNQLKCKLNNPLIDGDYNQGKNKETQRKQNKHKQARKLKNLENLKEN